MHKRYKGKKETMDINRHEVADRKARMLSGEMDSDEAEEMTQWFRRSEKRCEELQAMSELYADIECLSDDPEILMALDDAHRKPNKSYKVAGIISIVASFLLAMVLITSFQEENNTESGKHYFTRIGERKTIELVDGSIVTMNTGTELQVFLSEDTRKVFLNQGEAFFKVSKDAKRPFSVILNEKVVTVVGTEFNIQKTPKDFTLAVFEGVVSLHRQGEKVLKSSSVLAENGTTEKTYDSYQRLITVGTVARFDLKSEQLTGYKPNDIAKYQDWFDGTLMFENQPLSKVIKELNRYSRKKILIEDSQAMDLRIYATLNPERMDSTLIVLEKMLPINIVHYFDRIVIESVEINSQK